MKVIYKFPLDITDSQKVMLPSDFEILKIGFQGLTLMLWALVDPQCRVTWRTITIVGTGHEFDPGHKSYIDTVFMGDFVWHVFVDIPEATENE